MFVRKSTHTITSEYNKACNWAERIALHKPGVCEEKHAYNNITEYNKACKLKESEGIALHKPTEGETKHAYNNITKYNLTKRANLNGVEGCEAKHA